MSENNTLGKELRRLIQIENSATPAEAYQFIDENRSEYPGLVPFLNKLELMMAEASNVLRPFTKLTLVDNVSLYKSKSKNRSLVVGFCGRANRLMIPIPVFLQYIPENHFDVLILQDPSNLNFHNGVPGMANDLSGSMCELKKIIGQYEFVSTIGTSGGAYAALFISIYLKSNRAVSIGARHPAYYTHTMNHLVNNGLTGSEFKNLVMGVTQLNSNFLTVYSELNSLDKDSAKLIQSEIQGLKMLPILESDSHNCIEIMRQNGELSNFLDTYLLY